MTRVGYGPPGFPFLPGAERHSEPFGGLDLGEAEFVSAVAERLPDDRDDA